VAKLFTSILYLVAITVVSLANEVPFYDGKSTVWLYAKTGKLPKPIKLSPNVTVWKLSDIEQMLAQLK